MGLSTAPQQADTAGGARGGGEPPPAGGRSTRFDGTARRPPAAPARSGRLIGRVLPWVLSAVLLAVAARSTTDVRQGLHDLAAVSPRWVVGAIACEVLAYASLSAHLRLLSGSPREARRLAPVRTALLVFGLGSIMPVAPAEGIVMATTAHRRRGADPQRSALVLGLSQWYSLAGITLVTATTAVAVGVFQPGFPGSSWIGLAGAAALVGLGLFAWFSWRPGTAAWVGLATGRLRHPMQPAPARERRQQGLEWRDAALSVVDSRRHAAALLLTMAAGWLGSALCFTVALRGVGQSVALPIAVLAFVLGVQATALPFLPAGAGVLEAVASSVLALAGVPVPAALAGVVVYRLVGTLLPAMAGLLALLSLRWSPGAPPADDARAPSPPDAVLDLATIDGVTVTGGAGAVPVERGTG